MSANKSGEVSFSRLRQIFWPIHTHEMKKFMPMTLIMFCVLFNYTCLRNTKDTLVVTAEGSGAEALQFLKTFCVTPSAVLFMLLYTKMSNIFSKENIFYAALTPFIVFFAAFAWILYPNREVLHPALQTVQQLQADFPAFHWFFAIYGNWTYAIFYALAELWGSVILSLSFWQFANQITPVVQAKRFYALFGLLGNLGTIAAGLTVNYFSDIRATLPPEVDAWGVSLTWMMSTVVLCGIVAMGLYRWMHVSVLTDKRFYDPEAVAPKKKKAKPSLGESFRMIFQSKYLGLIALLLLGYGISINLVEGVWKSQVKIQFPNPNDYSAFMGKYSIFTGALTILFMLAGANIMRLFRWFTAAVITPTMILVTGILFFVFVLFHDSLEGLIEHFGTTAVMLAVVIGALQGILSKSVKYALFDPTKEMAYIPLDEELKVKGKAVVDVVGGRLGKSGGAVIQTLLLQFVGVYSVISPIIFGIFMVICVLWIMAVGGLSKEFTRLTQKNKANSEV
jgi:AAA family ATP:ADP antiporter